ncbi:MAG: S8 family serine peptidase [Oscillospiraceae bacterium]
MPRASSSSRRRATAARATPPANADDVYPANQAAALTVSAVDRSRTFDDSYSASGASVDLCAPGSCVAVAAPGGGMAVRSGTSFAAPHVAAAAACVQLAQPGADRRARAPDALSLCRGPRRARPRRRVRPRLSGAHAVLSRPAVPGPQRSADMPEPDVWSHAGLDYCIARG